MIAFLILLFVAFVIFRVIPLRLCLFHPVTAVYNACRDLWHYIIYRKWREFRTGYLIAYVGLFGKGKTLSAVHYVMDCYRHYNGLKVYDQESGRWVTQRIYVISNVDLAIPFEKFVSLRQVVDVPDRMKVYDAEHGTRTCTLVLGDEFSVQLNSRDFRKNIDPLFLNTLLTCRHHRISLIYTSQRFSHVDALLRQVTSYVVSCNKIWRFMVHCEYDAFQLESAADPGLVMPVRSYGWFIRDRDFNAYDTYACVGNLRKSCLDGDMMSEEEILSLVDNKGVQLDGVSRPSKSVIRAQKKMHK